MILSSLLRIIFFLACAFTTMPCQEFVNDLTKTPNVALLVLESTWSYLYGEYINEVICVVNNNTVSSAIAWTTWGDSAIASEFVQDENNYYLQCDSNNCANYLGSGKWMAYSSFNAQVGHLDDYRWEKLPVHTTSGRYEFPYVRPTPQHSPWNITMSIRGRNDASIVLCEGVNPFNSGCYWIILGGWPNLNRIGETNVIRKCVNGVPIKGFPKDECKTKRDQYKGWSLSEKEWKHASIHWSKSNESAELLVTVQGIQKPILHFVDRQYLDIKYVSFRSMNMELQWRVHEYQFWGTSSNGSSLISREFQPKSKNLCLSFFYSIPTAVGLSSTLTMQASNRAGLLQHLATFQNKQDDTINWKYAQVLTTREYWDYIKIMFTVHMEWEDQSITSDPRQYVFGVDSIRGCDPKGDVRTLKLQSYRSQVTGGDPPSCQLLQKSQLTLKPAIPNLNSNKCGPDRFMHDCSGSCEYILGENYSNCSRVTLCQANDGVNTECSCSPGFEGNECQNKCISKKYGQGCASDCGNCSGLRNCHYITGFCSDGCQPGYATVYCNTTFPILNAAPETLSVFSKNMTIKVRLHNFRGQGEPKYYQLQFKVEFARMWMKSTKMLVTNEDITVVQLLNLEPLTNYRVRVVLFDMEDNSYEENDVPEAIATTICEDIVLKPPVAGSYIITLSWNVKEEGSNCPVDQYFIELSSSSDQTTRQERLYRSDPTVMTGLRPFTNYSVVMKKYTDKKTVQLYQSNVFTLQAAPGLIKSLEVISTSTTSLNIQWDKPEQPNGIISHYNISYRHNGYLGCTVAAGAINDQSRGTFRVNATELHIQDLTPYSRYTIMVMGYTVAYGPSIMKSVETDQTELPEETPVLLNDSIKIYPFSIYFRWKPSQDCKDIKGIISQYKVIVCGISPWSEGTRKEYTSNTARFDFKDAIPYTKYNISILAMRPSGKVNLNKSLNITLQTTEYTLEPVRDLTAYSMGPKWISLRWKEPYPPYGRVESYNIEYNKQRSSTKTIQIRSKSSPCELWDNMICVTLENLEKDSTYEIKVQAFNSKTGGQITAQSTRTVEKAPTAPLNLTVISAVENKTTLYWQHPDKTNGKLNKFKFQVTAIETWLLQSQGLNFNWEYDITRETRNYTYTLEGFFPSTKYRVDVCGVTVESGDLTSVTMETKLSVPSFNETVTVVEDSLTNMTATIQLPAAHRYLTNSSAFFVMVGCQRCSLSTTKDTAKLKDEALYSELLNQIKFQQYVDVWIAAEIQPNPKGNRFIIGDNRTSKPCQFGSGYMNRPLKPHVSYYIVVVVLNQQGSDRVFHTLKLPSALTLAQEPETGNKGSNLGWIALLLIIIVPVLLYLLYKKRVCFHQVHKPTLEMRMDSRKNIDGQLLKPPAPEPEPEMEDSPGSLQKSLSQRLSRRVNISDLENYVRVALQSGELQRQHALFARGQTQPWDYGRLPENKSKNRYGNLVAYDRTRVVLKKLPGDEFSDYINANYIAGYKADKFYIATQGPRPTTVVDFWRMVWQEQVSVIAMLANVIENGKKKCEQYWPELGKEETHGAVTILTADVSVFADFTFRHFNISCKSKKRKVSHLHFTSWPDHGVPFYPQSVAAYLKKLLLTPRGTGPILVHCSAGVGRTGTIILADICLRMAAAEGAVDILGFQQSMREQRPNMVDNLEQYKLVHLVLLECLVEEPSSYPCDDTLPQLINRLNESGTLYKQFQRLQEVQWLDQALKPPSGAQVDKARIPQPTDKDRCPNIIPGYNGRVYLTRYPLEDTTSDYINAVSVDGFRTKDQFIVTQFPLKNTVGDFWRMVLEKNIPLIVVLNEIDMSDKSLSMCEFRPLADQPLTPVPYLTVRLKQQSHNAIWSVTTYQLTDTSVTTGLPQQQIVRMLQLSGWQANCDLPPNVNTLLQLWQEVERLYSGKCPILVTCLDGTKSCGLFLAVAFLVEKIKLEQQCDVCHAVRTIRQNREQFITTEEQFQFLYAVAVNYLEAFQTYANFN